MKTQLLRRASTFSISAIILLLIATSLIIILQQKRPHEPRLYTLDDLPKNAQFVEHPADIAEAKNTGGIVMRHYATPEALATGGPIYGTMGYRIISIEYEIPSEAVKERPIGKNFSSGWNLKLDALPKVPYDHFHLGLSTHSHTYKSREDEIPHAEKAYLIHFMLITHEEELAYGLVCG